MAQITTTNIVSFPTVGNVMQGNPIIISCEYDFSDVSTFDIDLRQQQATNEFEQLCSVEINTFLCDQFIVFTEITTGNKIVVPPFSCMTSPIYSKDPIYRVTSVQDTSSSPNSVQINFTNYFQAAKLDQYCLSPRIRDVNVVVPAAGGNQVIIPPSAGRRSVLLGADLYVAAESGVFSPGISGVISMFSSGKIYCRFPVRMFGATIPEVPVLSWKISNCVAMVLAPGAVSVSQTGLTSDVRVAGNVLFAYV